MINVPAMCPSVSEEGTLDMKPKTEMRTIILVSGEISVYRVNMCPLEDKRKYRGD